MRATEAADYETILKIVSGWPSGQRFTLLQDVLKTLASEARAAPAKRPTLDLALGLLATDQAAPSDTQVAQWLEEYRTEKYG